MRLLAIIAACVLITCDGLPVQIPEVERVFDYRGQTYISSTLGSKQISKWNLYSKIVFQTFKDHAVIKLNDIETSLFNGYTEDEFDVLKKKVPEEANILGEPFIMLYNTSIKTGENEPNWSLNIKRAIAGILYVDIHKLNEPTTHTVEETMYGRCNVTYTTGQEYSSLKLIKTINTDQCGGEIQDYYTVNRQYECPEYEHDQFPREVVRTYYMDDKTNPHKINKILAESSIVFQVTPSDVQTFQLKQIQTMYMEKYEDIKNKIDTSKATAIHDIKFTHGRYPMDGRTTNTELSYEELITNLLEKLETLRTESKEETSLNHWKISDGLDNVFDAFVNQTLDTLEEVSVKIERDKELEQIFLSYLPYVGSPATAKTVIKLAGKGNIEIPIKLRMLALFPKYINENNEDILKFLQNSYISYRDHDLVYNSVILAVGQMIGYMKKDDTMPKEIYDQYLNDYQKRLRATKNGEEKIVYMMAIKNMDPPLQSFLDIIEDETLSQDIKILAINSCLPKMKHKSKTMRDKLLPILKNETLNLDLRVAALNGLIESRMPVSKFEQVFEYLKEEKGDTNHRHLYHYLFSSLASYRYDTKCKTGLSDLAETYLPKMKEPTGENTWMTGNFRTSFTNKGNDFGSIHQLRIVADPKTNAIETVEFTMDHSMMGLRKQYKIYWKAIGVFSEILKAKLSNKKFNSIKEFVDILKENSFKLHDTPFEWDLLIIADNKAVFAGKFTKKDFSGKFNLAEYFVSFMQMFFKDGFLIKYPIMDYLHIPSDLGTDLTLGLDQEELDFITTENFEKLLLLQSTDYTLNYRTYLATSKSFHVYNPIDSVKQGGHNINMRNTYFEMKFNLKSKDGKLEGLEIKSDNIKFSYNSEMLTQLFAMDEKAVKKYCPKCEIEQTIYDEKQQLVEDKTIPLGFYNMTIKSNRTKFSDIVLETVNEQVGNYEVFPLNSLYHMVEGYYLWDHYLPKWATNSLTWKLEHKDPLNISFKFTPSYEDLKNDNEVLPGSVSSVSTNILVKKIKEDEILYDIDATTTLREEPGLYNRSFEQTVEIAHGKKYLKACITKDMLIPKISPDYYSISPANPMLVNLGLQFGVHDKKGEKCSDNQGFSINLEAECTVLDEQKELMTKADEYPYKQCKEDSKNLKYTAPTETCNMASKEMNKYRKFDLDFKISAHEEISEILPFDKNTIKAMYRQYNNVHEKATVEFGIKRKSLLFTHNKGNNSMFKFEAWAAKHVYPFVTEEWLPSAKDFLPEMDEDIVTLGFTSTCVITNKNAKTFYGNSIDHPKDKKENIALIECKKAKEGVMYQFDKNGQLELKVWIEEDVIIAKPKGKELQVIVNDTELEKDKWISSDKLKVYHLADDAIVIRGPLMEIYYNIEYININIISIYNDKICGICST